MILKPLNKYDMEQVRQWRNEVPETLRTPYALTEEQQEQYYRDVICNRESHTRYWGLFKIQNEIISDSRDLGKLILLGYGGIENIEWENSRGEISVLISPEYRGKGFGRKAVELFLDQAFNYMNLDTVWGEVYACGHHRFWELLVADYNGFMQWVPMVKYYNGIYHDALYFTFFKEAFNEVYYTST